MNKPQNVIFETVSGSHAYGLNTPKSDVDIRGVFQYPLETHLSLIDLPAEVSSNSQDIKYFELKKFFLLAKDCNPNIIELLWMPKECIRIHTAVWDLIERCRDLFISKKAFYTFSGYAYAQIKKATGQNKLINNPIKEKPKKEDFCWVIPSDDTRTRILRNATAENFQIVRELVKFPNRPVAISALNIDLTKYHIAALEHVSNAYRLYFYGDGAKGVFRGDGMLTIESIPCDDEWSRFEGILIYNEQEYEKSLRAFNQYQEWIENRNTERWKLQEDGKLNYDQKNMMHTFRLLYSGMNIFTNGFPLVRFTGELREFLMDIRNGKFTYDFLIKKAEDEMEKLTELKDKSTLKTSCNPKKINELFIDCFAPTIPVFEN